MDDGEWEQYTGPFLLTEGRHTVEVRLINPTNDVLASYSETIEVPAPLSMKGATASPTVTPSATALPTATPSATPSPTVTPSATPSPTVTPSVTASPTATPSATLQILFFKQRVKTNETIQFMNGNSY